MNDELDALFGGKMPQRPTFTERVAKTGHSARPVFTDDGMEVGGYKAVGAMPSAHITETCALQSWVPGSDVPLRESFHYRYMHGVTCVGDTMLTIKLIGGLYLIEGRRLAGLDDKLMRGTVSYLQEYHPRIWPMPQDDMPFITRIELMRP